MIRKKAIEMNKKLTGNPDFNATFGWLMRFKFRHGIKDLNMQSEKLSAYAEYLSYSKILLKKGLIRRATKKTCIMQMKRLCVGRKCQQNL